MTCASSYNVRTRDGYSVTLRIQGFEMLHIAFALLGYFVLNVTVKL